MGNSLRGTDNGWGWGGGAGGPVGGRYYHACLALLHLAPLFAPLGSTVRPTWLHFATTHAMTTIM